MKIDLDDILKDIDAAFAQRPVAEKVRPARPLARTDPATIRALAATFDPSGDFRPLRGNALRQALTDQVDAAQGEDPVRQRLPWPDRWLTDSDPSDAKQCAAMWKAVMAAGLRDAIKEASVRGIMPGWVGTRDYVEVFELAGYGAGYAATVAARIQSMLGDSDKLLAILNGVTRGPQVQS